MACTDVTPMTHVTQDNEIDSRIKRWVKTAREQIEELGEYHSGAEDTLGEALQIMQLQHENNEIYQQQITQHQQQITQQRKKIEDLEKRSAGHGTPSTASEYRLACTQTALIIGWLWFMRTAIEMIFQAILDINLDSATKQWISIILCVSMGISTLAAMHMYHGKPDNREQKEEICFRPLALPGQAMLNITGGSCKIFCVGLFLLALYPMITTYMAGSEVMGGFSLTLSTLWKSLTTWS